MLRHVVSVVTGGASGLGAATAREIVRQGGKVLVMDLPHQEESFRRCGDLVENIKFFAVDVTSPEQVSAALDCVEDIWKQPVNVAVNCAGIAPARKTLSNDGSRVHPLEEMNQTLHVNVLGTFNVTRLAAQRMAAEKKKKNDDDGGCIVNKASIAANYGQGGQVAYAASKAAIVGMTLPLARDLAPHKIRVMTIAPGLFLTPLLEALPSHVQSQLGQTVPHPSRLGHPHEYAQLVTSILTNPMLNGEVIRLDGALRMPP